jgi:hypothetical protein
MGPTNPIQDACEKYIRAVFRAKEAAETADDFWGNKRADKAYWRLFKAIADNTPADLVRVHGPDYAAAGVTFVAGRREGIGCLWM